MIIMKRSSKIIIFGATLGGIVGAIAMTDVIMVVYLTLAFASGAALVMGFEERLRGD